MPANVRSTEAEGRRRAAAELVAAHDAALRRTARRHSLCAADAEDAYQRALLVALRKAPAIEPAALARWMHVVTRREAWAVRRGRERTLYGDGQGGPVATGPEPAEVAERRERIAHAARALATLKPAERRALALLAAGLSYAEIGELCGWSYTKVNRLLAEGRAALRERMARLDGS
ncbi:MAG TPA: RNA polymerase sigma factor [Solirubrobacterales bacterium]